MMALPVPPPPITIRVPVPGPTVIITVPGVQGTTTATVTQTAAPIVQPFIVHETVTKIVSVGSDGKTVFISPTATTGSTKPIPTLMVQPTVTQTVTSPQQQQDIVIKYRLKGLAISVAAILLGALLTLLAIFLTYYFAEKRGERKAILVIRSIRQDLARRRRKA